MFDHCCRSHAALHRNPPQTLAQSAGSRSGFQQQQCLFAGCQLLRSVDKTTGMRYDYCSKAHADAAAMGLVDAPPAMGSTTTTTDHSGLRAPSSGLRTYLPQCKHSGCTRPCAADAKTGLVHHVCEAHSSVATNSTTNGDAADGTPPDPSTQAPTGGAAVGGTTRSVMISAVAQAVPPPPPTASSAPGRVVLPFPVPPGRCQLDGCMKLSAVDTTTRQRHDFCCAQHAQQAKNAGKAGGLVNRGGASSAAPGPAAVCMLPGCAKPQAPGFDHCCKEHALAARKPMCTLPGCYKDAWFDSQRKEVKELKRWRGPLRLFTHRFFRRILRNGRRIYAQSKSPCLPPNDGSTGR